MLSSEVATIDRSTREHYWKTIAFAEESSVSIRLGLPWLARQNNRVFPDGQKEQGFCELPGLGGPLESSQGPAYESELIASKIMGFNDGNMSFGGRIQT